MQSQTFNSIKEVLNQFSGSTNLNFTNFHPRTEDKRVEPNLLFVWIKSTSDVIHTYQKDDEIWKEVF